MVAERPSPLLRGARRCRFAADPRPRRSSCANRVIDMDVQACEDGGPDGRRACNPEQSGAALGGAWFELEHTAAGIDFGRGVGDRLDWLDEAASALRTLFDGGRVTSEPGAHYAFDDLVLLPRPVQQRLPLLIGGGGEKKTL